jgi:hypothetical protein
MLHFLGDRCQMPRICNAISVGADMWGDVDRYAEPLHAEDDRNRDFGTINRQRHHGCRRKLVAAVVACGEAHRRLKARFRSPARTLTYVRNTSRSRPRRRRRHDGRDTDRAPASTITRAKPRPLSIMANPPELSEAPAVDADESRRLRGRRVGHRGLGRQPGCDGIEFPAPQGGEEVRCPALASMALRIQLGPISVSWLTLAADHVRRPPR